MAGVRTFLEALLAVALCLGLLGPLRLAQYFREPCPVGTVRVEVRPGAGPADVARVLRAAGIAPWPWGTRLAQRLWGHPDRLKAGLYAFSGPVSLQEVFADLEAGRVEQVRVTFPEGLTARDMGRLLGQAGITDRERFIALAYDPSSPDRWQLPGPSLEGFLFPDTYRFARNLDPTTVADAMIRRFREVSAPLLPRAEAGGLGLREWVTLASIVEKETGLTEEKPLVAAVFLNRLARHMRLESDPTVIYGISHFDGNLRRADLLRDTPYNTYTRAGLPQGPIANPGRESLEAVLHPAAVGYLYFVSRNDGSHVFSRTYEEHRRSVRRYQGRAGR